MSTTDTTSINDVSTTPLSAHQLARLEDQLTHLLACYEFYDHAIRAITSPDYQQEIDGHQWHLGLFLQQQWLQDQGQDIIQQLQTIRQGLHSR